MHTRSSTTLISRRALASPRGVGLDQELFIAKAQNELLWDIDGNRYIDFSGDDVLLSAGHCHPDVINAVRKQLDQFTNGSHHRSPYRSYIELSERLNQLAPRSGAMKTAFYTTAAEALAGAVSIARAASRKRTVLILGENAKFPRDFAEYCVSDVARSKRDIRFLPFPVDEITTDHAQRTLNSLIRNRSEAARIAAIVVDPVPSHRAFKPIAHAAFHWIREICDRYRILLIADESRSGFGRTGRMFATEHYTESFGVTADMYVFGSALAGGFPLTAVTGLADIMDAAPPEAIGSACNGHPPSVVAALAVLDLIESDELCHRATLLGQSLRAALVRLGRQNDCIVEINGMGSMLAVRFGSTSAGRITGEEMARAVLQAAWQHGLLLARCHERGDTLAFLYPLTITQTHFDEGLRRFEQALKAASAVTCTQACSSP